MKEEPLCKQSTSSQALTVAENGLNQSTPTHPATTTFGEEQFGKSYQTENARRYTNILTKTTSRR